MLAVFNNSKYPFINACVATIGNFDGVHLGHTTLINACVQRAKELSLPSVVITFDPHPSTILAQKPALPLISLQDRIKYIEELQVDYCFVLSFDREFASQRTETFVKKFLVDQISCKELYTGYNFRMGKDKVSKEDLGHLLEKYDIELNIQEEVFYNDKSHQLLKISSTAIRQTLADGQIELTNSLLNRLHCVIGKVEHGAKRGSSLLGFPTANMDTGNLLLPKPGVYATSATLLHDTKQETYKSISNIGYNPTFAENKLLIETHIIDFNEDIYHQDLQVCFHTRIRDEKKFSSVEDLITQLNADKEFRLEL